MSSAANVRRPSVLLAALAVLVAGVLGAPPRSEAATNTGTVSGQITLGGKPVSGLTVRVYGAEDGGYDVRSKAVTTDSAGRFRITFSSGSTVFYGLHYWYEYDDPTHRVIAGRRDFRIKAGESVVKNAGVHTAAEVTGYAKLPEGADSSRLRVRVVGPTTGQANRGDGDDVRRVYPTTLTPRPSGFYRAWGLPPGDYRFEIFDPALEYQSACADGSAPVYDNDSDVEQRFPDDLVCSSAPVSVTYGEKKTAPTHTLSTKAGTISGRIRETRGELLDLSRFQGVYAVRADGMLVSASSNSSGVFRLRGLPSGTWRLRVETEDLWEGRYYGGDGTEAGAATIELGAGEAVTGRDVTVRTTTTSSASISTSQGKAVFTVAVRRKVDGKPAHGAVVVVLGGVRKTIELHDTGRGVATFTGLEPGKQGWKVAYLGDADDAPSRRLGTVTLR